VGDARLWFLEMVQELQRRHDQQEPCRRAPPDGPRLSKPARRQRRGRRRRSTREDVKVGTARASIREEEVDGGLKGAVSVERARVPLAEDRDWGPVASPMQVGWIDRRRRAARLPPEVRQRADAMRHVI
jgi:hypothetical protein